MEGGRPPAHTPAGPACDTREPRTPPTPQARMVPGEFLVDPKKGPYKTLAELWDE